MKTVKVTYPNPELSRGNTPFPQQSPGSKGIWGDYQFVFDNDTEEYDYWIVVDRIETEQTCRIPKRNTIFLTQESPAIGAYPVSFLNQFGTVITCHPDILENPDVTSHKIAMHPALAWFVNKSYDELSRCKSIPKTKTISLITSKTNRKRYEFALTLKDYFGDDLDLFGRGINPVADKWDALAPYRYSIILENTLSPYYFSEKLADAYLARTYPIYYGGAGERYFPGAFAGIDIDDPDMAIRIIETLINSPEHYALNLPELQEARRKILTEYNFFPTILSVIRKHPDYFDAPGTNLADITISNKGNGEKNRMMFFKKIRRTIFTES